MWILFKGLFMDFLRVLLFFVIFFIGLTLVGFVIGLFIGIVMVVQDKFNKRKK